jgi:hypothetical protein
VQGGQCGPGDGIGECAQPRAGTGNRGTRQPDPQDLNEKNVDDPVEDRIGTRLGLT